jgi:hypothetical protein
VNYFKKESEKRKEQRKRKKEKYLMGRGPTKLLCTRSVQRPLPTLPTGGIEEPLEKG